MNKSNLMFYMFIGGMCSIFLLPIFGAISGDVSNQCKHIAGNTSISYNKCYMDNVPFPLNVDISDWHIWKVNKP